MRKFVGLLVCLLVVFLVVCFSTVAESAKRVVLPLSAGTSHPERLAQVDTFYYEDFETGAGDWTSGDLREAPSVWHSDTFKAYGGSGKSWWMGAPEIGGYLDHWYQVLDSPEIILPAGACSLKFVMNRELEGLTGPFPSGYNGWDGFNVRISTDGGASWEILLAPTPAYNSTSMFSFGWEHAEGKDIPGWGGSSGDWVDVVFDISSYAEDTAKIRWAFASDPGYCTTDDATLFGVLVDNIDVAGVFTNDGEDTTGWTCSSVVPSGLDIWHITVDSFAPTPTHAVYCGDDVSGTYIPNLRNAYISPLIPLPEEADTIVANFWLRGGFEDADTMDYFGAQLSPDSGKTWYFVSNPTGTGTDYIYLMPPDTPWGTFNDYFTEPEFIDVSTYAGGVVQFRVWLCSDEDTPIGEGLFIDDFMVYAISVGVEEHSHHPQSFKLYQNSPNPFTRKTVIRYSLPVNCNASLKIYDLSGRLVRSFPESRIQNPESRITWDGRDNNGKAVTTGIYFYELNSGNLKETRKLVFLK